MNSTFRMFSAFACIMINLKHFEMLSREMWARGALHSRYGWFTNLRWPELLSKFLQMLWCAPIAGDNGGLSGTDQVKIVVDQRLLLHPDVVCWSQDHLSMAVIACTGLAVWCAAVPLLLFQQIYFLKDLTAMLLDVVLRHDDMFFFHVNWQLRS